MATGLYGASHDPEAKLDTLEEWHSDEGIPEKVKVLLKLIPHFVPDHLRHSGLFAHGYCS
jgi:hypothetical protein